LQQGLESGGVLKPHGQRGEVAKRVLDADRCQSVLLPQRCRAQ
jgi:hypothetical protein